MSEWTVVRIKRVDFRENIWAVRQDKRKCQLCTGVREAGFHCFQQFCSFPRSLTFSGNRIHFMLLIIRLILCSLTHLGLQLWQEKLASTPRDRLKERWKGTLEEIEYDKSERQKHGWLREKRFGHNSLQIWYVYFKSKAPSSPQVVVSVFLFSLR